LALVLPDTSTRSDAFDKPRRRSRWRERDSTSQPRSR
jgi:hypothetical protein